MSSIVYSPCCRAYFAGEQCLDFPTESPQSNFFLGERQLLAEGGTVPYGHLRRGDVSARALLGVDFFGENTFSSRTGEKCNARARAGLIAGQLRGVKESGLVMSFWGVFSVVKVEKACTLVNSFRGDRGILSGLVTTFRDDKLMFSAARLLNGEQSVLSEKIKIVINTLIKQI